MSTDLFFDNRTIGNITRERLAVAADTESPARWSTFVRHWSRAFPARHSKENAPPLATVSNVSAGSGRHLRRLPEADRRLLLREYGGHHGNRGLRAGKRRELVDSIILTEPVTPDYTGLRRSPGNPISAHEGAVLVPLVEEFSAQSQAPHSTEAVVNVVTMRCFREVAALRAVRDFCPHRLLPNNFSD